MAKFTFPDFTNVIIDIEDVVTYNFTVNQLQFVDFTYNPNIKLMNLYEDKHFIFRF